MDKLYLSRDLNPVDVTDVIDKLFRDKKTKKACCVANATYYNKDCTELQSVANWRSFEDMLALARGYFPKTTKLQFMDVLIKFKISLMYCSDIKKIVFMRSGGSPLNKTELNRRKHNQYCMETYTPNDLIKLLNNETFTSRIRNIAKRLS